MNEHIDKVNDLLTMAQHESTPEHEARAAAFQAVRLMAKHGLTVSKPRVTIAHGVADWAPYAEYAREYVEPPPANPSQRKRIMSKYDGHCSVCSDKYEAGRMVWWAKSKGAICSGCYNAGA